jgi:hypothetical protein
MNKLLSERMLRVYTRRLLEALSEVDITDKEGNILISKDLKVIHKDSGYEYTIDDVITDTDGNVTFALRAPEDPRVEPQGAEGILMTSLDTPRNRRGAHQHPDDLQYPPEEGEIYIVDEEAFKKEYEVK